VIVSLVRFTSKLDDESVQAMFGTRSDLYRDVPGLIVKLYMRFRGTGEFGAVYVWQSEGHFTRFRESALARTIADVYQIEEVPTTELADVCLIVQPDRVTISGQVSS
jgi:hypothetical protein